MMHKEELIGEPGSIEEKGLEGLCLQHEWRDPVQKTEEEDAGQRGRLHRKIHGERKQEEKRRQSEEKEPDPFSFLKAVPEPEI